MSRVLAEVLLNVNTKSFLEAVAKSGQDITVVLEEINKLIDRESN